MTTDATLRARPVTWVKVLFGNPDKPTELTVSPEHIEAVMFAAHGLSSPMKEDDMEMVERVAAAIKSYFVEHTGFSSEYDDEGTVAAFYGGHWVTLNTREIARAALSASRVQELVEALSPWLRHTLSCVSQRDLHDDTICRCGLDATLAKVRNHA